MIVALSLLLMAQFVPHPIADDLKGGYQVVIADLNKDGRPDIIALASGMDELVWFENQKPEGDSLPRFQRHVIVSGQKKMINCAAWDTDGDGIPEIVLASEFDNQPKKSVGLVTLLKHTGDPTKPWAQREIDRLPSSHRIRWVDLDGSGRKVAVNAPLAGAQADPPDYRAVVPLVFYVPGGWQRETMNNTMQGVVHGLAVDGNSVLTAGFQGIQRHSLKNGYLVREEIWKGNSAPWPKSGSSDVAVGKGFLAAIESWHGNQVVIYEKGRTVIDESLNEGHTIQVMSDGTVVAGHRGQSHGVNLYRKEKKKWVKTVLDESVAANSCEIADLDGDGKEDIVCIGGSTANLKWFQNR